VGNFDDAFAATMAHEGLGVFTNDPVDRGGATYSGISRRFFPAWAGWLRIDSCLKAGIAVSSISAELLPDVKSFYKENFWDRFAGDILPPDVAKELFDSAVNCGVTTAGKWLQRSLNLLNRNGTAYLDLTEDGKIGPSTARVLAAMVAKEGTGMLLKVLNILQGAHYIAIMQKNPSQERFARGWLARVKI